MQLLGTLTSMPPKSGGTHFLFKGHSRGRGQNEASWGAAFIAFALRSSRRLMSLVDTGTNPIESNIEAATVTISDRKRVLNTISPA